MSSRRKQDLEKWKKEKSREELVWKLGITVGIIVVILLLMFLPWAEVYNTDIGGAEVKYSGWSALIAGISGNFTSAESVFGDIAVPFNFYAGNYCQIQCILTIPTLILLLCASAVAILSALKSSKVLKYITLGLFAVCGVMFCLVFLFGILQKEGNILSAYCGGNPACSIKSFAIIPAILCFAMSGLSVFLSKKSV